MTYQLKITLDITSDFREQVIDAALPAIGGFFEEHGADVSQYTQEQFTDFMNTCFDVMAVAVLQKQVIMSAPEVIDQADRAKIGL